MAVFTFADNVNTTLAAAVTTTTQTTITLSSTTNLPASIPAGQYLAVTLNDAATQNVFETVYATARSGAVLTVIRGQDGTTAQTWLVNDYVYCSVTAGILNSFINQSTTAQAKSGDFSAGTLGVTTPVAGAFSSHFTSGNTGGLVADATAGVGDVGLVNNYAGGGFSFYNYTTGTTWAKIASIDSAGNFAGNSFTATAGVSAANLSASGTVNTVNLTAGNGSFSNSLTTVAFTNTGTSVLQGTSISGGGGTPSVYSAGANLASIQGNSSTSGVQLVNINTSTLIAQFLSNTTVEATISNVGVYTAISDRRKKKQIRKIKGAIDDVMLLKPVRFEWKKGSKADIGFIAQDVAEVLPELVTEIGDGFFGVSYSGVIPVLTAAIQEQQRTIVAQQKQIDALIKAVAKL